MIPIVDIGQNAEADHTANTNSKLKTSDLETKRETARQLHDAICNYGFCFLTNHGLPQNVLDNVMSTSKTFFELPVDTKVKYVRPEKLNHGWVACERERLNPERPYADLKEAFNFSPCEEGTWPTSEEVPGMRSSFSAMYEQCRQLTLKVLDLLGVALDFEDPAFLKNCHQLIGKGGNYTSLRSLYYPPSLSMKEGQIQCGEHSDYGSITLLFQDNTGGLQVQDKDGVYHDVTPVPGAVLVNIGDLMQRWTADKYPSTKHRVIVPKVSPSSCKESGSAATTTTTTTPTARQSLAFFAHPDDATLITSIDGSNKYPPITSLDYLLQRFNATY